MNLFAISGILIGISSATMATLMIVIARQRLHYIWSAFCVSVAFWGFGAYMIATTAGATKADFWWRVTHIGVIFIPVFFTHFVYEYLGRKDRAMVWWVYIMGFAFLWVNFSGNLFIANMRWVFDQFYYDSPPGILYIPFTFFFVFLIVYNNVLLWNAMKKEKGLRKAQIQYFLGGMLVSFAGGSLSFLPVYHIDLYPVFNIMAFLYTPILTYAIVKTRLFDVRILLTQILVGVIAFLLLINFISAITSFEYFWKGALFVIFLPVGYMLIRSIMNEIDAREIIEQLARDLQGANKELGRINQAKSDFISMVSHQLKTPLSIIKGYISMTLEGSFGKITKKITDQLQKVYISNERLIALVDDLLNLSRVEEGRMKYDFSEENITDIVQQIVDEVQMPAQRKKLRLIWERPTEKLYARVDLNKMRNVIFNLVDNAIKYTAAGSITIIVYKHDTFLRVAVSDTGRGISSQQIKKLFTKFMRVLEGKDSLTTSGFGLGLYVAKLIVEEQQGHIWAESAGLGKGSTFVLELPLVELEKSKRDDMVKEQL